MKLKVGEIDPFSSLAYPQKSSIVIYLQGCNFRCPWCWNREYLDPIAGKDKEIEEVIQEVKEDPSDTEAVVIDGGEPTKQPRALQELCERLKEDGYKVQINTNGSNPDVIEELGMKKNVDRVALDVKAPPDFQRRYSKIIGRKIKKKHLKGVKQVLRISNVFEFELEPRTTVIPGLTDNKHWIGKTAKTIGIYADLHVLQAFTPTKGTLKQEYQEEKRINREKLLELAEESKKYVKNVRIRTQETGTEQIV